MNQPTRYRWKRLRPVHFLAAIPLFAALYFPLDLLPGEESGGLALLPAMIFCFSSPRARREWLLAVLAALATAAAELAGMLAGYGIAGIWPPRALQTGSDAHQLVGAVIALAGAPVGFMAMHALAREPMTAAEPVERTLADAKSWHVCLLVFGSMAALFATMFTERILADGWLVAPPGFGLLAFLIFLSSGAVLVTASPDAGNRKAALFARSGLSLLIGVAGYAAYGAVYFRFDGVQPGLVVVIAMIAVHVGAPTLGWWQLKRFARREGLLQ
jgi:hypothetical protein